MMMMMPTIPNNPMVGLGMMGDGMMGEGANPMDQPGM